MGAPPPPMPPPVPTVSQQPQTQNGLSVCRLSKLATDFSCTDWLVFRFFRCSLCRDPQRTPFLCWCAIVAALSTWYQLVWQLCFPQLSRFCMTSLQTWTWHVPLLHVSAAVVTWPGSHGNVFTELLPCSGCLCWLNYSGFQRTCHNMKILSSWIWSYIIL
jgi:hypothetical protein